MVRSKGIGFWTLLLVGLVVAVPRAAAAQGMVEYPLLDRLHDDAIAAAYDTHAFPAMVREAAKLHRRVAEARHEDDARRFDCLVAQAALLDFTGDVQGARRFMERAAEHARATGDVPNAAMAFIDAAILAQDAGDVEWAAYLAHQARLLSYSPRLSPWESELILTRLGEDEG